MDQNEPREQDKLDERSEPGSDFDVEITDLDQRDEERSTHTPRSFVKGWLLSPRNRGQNTIATLICAGLALLILFALTPASQLFQRQSSPTASPPTYYFGLDANPPWGTLTVDGKRVALISRGGYALFGLLPGQHTLIWRAAPFAPQQCQVSVPLGSGRDTCLFPNTSPDLGSSVSGYISFPTSLATLSTAQRSALFQAAQALLDRQQSSDFVQAEQFYARFPTVPGDNVRLCTVALHRVALCYTTAHQPLTATLRLEMDSGPSPDAPCAREACDSSSQNCRLFCDVPTYFAYTPALPSTAWLVSVPVQLLWQFTTQDGQVVEENQADSFILGQQNAFGIPLNITWNGREWSVKLAGPPGNPINSPFGSDNPACQAAAQDIYALLLAPNASNFEFELIAGPTLASGCLVAIQFRPDLNGTPTLTPPSSTPAYVIHRFGVLLAVNAQAHRQWPFLPVADGATQRFAQQLIPNG